MQGVISVEEQKNSPCKKILHFDARTKLLATLVIAQIVVCGGNSEGYRYLRIAAICLPALLIFLEGYYGSAIRYAVIYTLLTLITGFASGRSAIGTVLVVFVSGFLCQFMPSMYLAAFLIKETPVREFIAAMKKMHAPDAIVIPVSVMFRFIPAIGEEYRAISQAMSMREIASVRNPVTMIEYRIVPLLMSILGIGNELSVAAVARGMGANAKRTSVYQVSLRSHDLITIFLLTGMLILSVVFLFT